MLLTITRDGFLLRRNPARSRVFELSHGRAFVFHPEASDGKTTIARSLDIEHRVTRPRTPRTNGMVERVNGRTADILKTHHFMSGEDLEQTLQTLLRHCLPNNEHLPQTTLNGNPPWPP
jgi:transposase InsO family protein